MKKAQKQESLHWGHRVTWLYSCYYDWWSFLSCILLRENFSEGTKTKFNPKPNTGTPIFNILCKGPKKRESRRSFVSSAKERATCQILTYCIDDIKLRDGWPDQKGWIFGKVPTGFWSPLPLFSENHVAIFFSKFQAQKGLFKGPKVFFLD